MSTQTQTLLTLSASVLLVAAIAAPSAALAQFGPPPGPPPALAGPPPGLAGPPPGLGAGGPPPGLGAGGPPARPIANLPARGLAGAPPRGLTGGPPRLDGAGGLRGLDRNGLANFRGVEGRAAAYSVPVTVAMAITMAVAAVTIAGVAVGAFWSVMETDWRGWPFDAPVLRRTSSFWPNATRLSGHIWDLAFQ
jgi:hypothetical protein